MYTSICKINGHFVPPIFIYLISYQLSTINYSIEETFTFFFILNESII